MNFALFSQPAEVQHVERFDFEELLRRYEGESKPILSPVCVVLEGTFGLPPHDSQGFDGLAR